MLRSPVFLLQNYLFFFNSTSTIIMSFLPIYLMHVGLSGTEIGWFLAIGLFSALFFQPMSGYLSDKWKTVKKIIIVCVIGMILSSLLLFNIGSFIPLLSVGVLFFIFMSPLGALGDSLAQKTSSQAGVSFGSIRMWGSVGFGVTSLITGQILSWIGIENVMYPFLFVAIACLITAFFLTDTVASKEPVELLDAIGLLKNVRLTLFLLVMMLIAIPHRMNDSFIGLYIKELGGNEALIGWSWFIATAVEALIFFISTSWFKRCHELTLMIIAGSLYGVRFISMAMIDNPLLFLFLQPIHGITFALFYTAGIQYVSNIVPQHILGTAHLLFITVFFGVSGIIASIGGGWIFENINGSVLYLFIGSLAFIGCLLMYIYKNKTVGKQVSLVSY